MTWLQEIRGVKAASIENPTQPLTSQSLVDFLVGPSTDSGVRVTEKTALGLPAVYRAIALIAGTSASLPLHAYRDSGETRERMSAQPRLVQQPHPDLTTFEWAELVYVHLLGWGNAYLRILRDQSGIVRELWPIEPARVSVGRTTTGQKVYGIDTADLSSAERTPTTGLLPLTDREVLHIPGLGYDGVSGMSPIRAARQSIGLAMATERHGARFFGSGTSLSGVLSTDQRLTPDQADQVKARWKMANAGPDNAHDIAVLGSGTNFTPISISPKDAEFVETQRFGVSQIARIFGVPPHMLFETDKSTSWGTGIEQQSIGFVTYTLRPWLVRVEQRLSRLLPSPQYVKFSVEGLLRGDTAQRASFYTSLWNLGAFSTNDIRRLEDMPPVDGGDVRYRPLNMGELGQPDPTPAPAETGAPNVG
jgi:HK97 family phage portal protein